MIIDSLELNEQLRDQNGENNKLQEDSDPIKYL